MNVDINVLPEELRPKPLIGKRTLMLIVLVVALGYGCYGLYGLKASSEVEAASAESRIEAIQDEVMSLSNNPEGKALAASVTEAKNAKAALEAAIQDYEEFVTAAVMWGRVLQMVSDWAPTGVTINSITEGGGNVLEVGGVASGFSSAAAYASALDGQEAFYDVGTLQWDAETGAFTLTVNVVPGGGR